MSLYSTLVDDDPEEREQRRGNAYMSFRDFKWILLIIVVFFLGFLPIYLHQREDANDHLCRNSLMQMHRALEMYAIEQGDSLPPIYAMHGGQRPLLDDQGRPSTWVTLINGYLSARASFRCRTATEEEIVRNQHLEGTSKTIESTYGMYAPYFASPRNLIPNPNETALLLETSNFGALDTYNPAPFTDEAGRPIPVDGFIVGFDLGNFVAERTREGARTSARFVTRLAFPGSSGGDFAKARSRHRKGINFVYADGHVGRLSAQNAAVRFLAPGNVMPPWSVPPGYRPLP